MHIARARLKLVTPYCQSRHHDVPKKDKESPADYEARTWREKMHFSESDVLGGNDDPEIVIPGMAMAACVKDAAAFLGMKVKGSETWRKHFDAGVMVVNDSPLGIKKSDAVEKKMFVPSNGVQGGGKRVTKSFPMIPSGIEFDVEYYILDEAITAPIFTLHLQQAGELIGIGAFRVRNRGVYGRFEVLQVEWEDRAHKLETPPIIYKNAA